MYRRKVELFLSVLLAASSAGWQPVVAQAESAAVRDAAIQTVGNTTVSDSARESIES
jgi:hypothetical protein